MTISIENIGKRYNYEWIFRHLHTTLVTGDAYAITGANGSGKSTLLRILSGNLSISEGKISYDNDGAAVAPEHIFQHCSMAAPYMELVEEFTLEESFRFYQQFKPLRANITIPEIISLISLSAAASKQIRYFSSGMKQRVKLAQAVFTDVPVILLDEPCTNLDAEGIALYHRLIRDFCRERLLVVSSNDQQEYSFCNKEIRISDYKS